MKYNNFKDIAKRYHKNSKEKVNLSQTSNKFSTSKNYNFKIVDQSSAKKHINQKEKISFSKDKFKQSIQRIMTDNNQLLNTTKRKSYSSKTPKANNTWLIRENAKKNQEQSSLRSKSKIDEKRQIYISKLENSMSPKAFSNIFTAIQPSNQSCKSNNTRYKSFHKQNVRFKKFFRLKKQKIQQRITQDKDIILIKSSLSDQQNKSTRSQIMQNHYYQVELRMKELSPEQQQNCKIKKNENRFNNEKKQVKQGNIDSYNCQSQLTQQEYQNFGDRFPSNFIKVALLGRGGFSLVWLGVQRKTKKKIAIKQILTKNPHQTHLKQIWFGSYFFNQGGEARQQFAGHPGINNICRLLAYDIKPQDTWLFYQLCEQSLGNSLYELKGQTINEERQYKIIYKQFYETLRQNPNELKFLLIQISKALMLINSHNIVHSDLKTENILLKFKKKQQLIPQSKIFSNIIKSVKIIDFGSSFLFTNLKQFSMATPQYMPPEILNYILFQNQLEYDQQLLQKIQKYKKPWVIDIWSLGCIILEIICGIPLWMSLKTKIQYKGQNTYASGLFAVKGRLFPKIICKQIQVVKKLDYHLDNDNYSGIKVPKDIRIILKKMLNLDPSQRISPRQILNHFNIQYQPDRFPFY